MRAGKAPLISSPEEMPVKLSQPILISKCLERSRDQPPLFCSQDEKIWQEGPYKDCEKQPPLCNESLWESVQGAPHLLLCNFHRPLVSSPPKHLLLSRLRCPHKGHCLQQAVRKHYKVTVRDVLIPQEDQGSQWGGGRVALWRSLLACKNHIYQPASPNRKSRWQRQDEGE